MDIHENATRIARLGALALGATIAGCGGGSPVAPLGQSVAPMKAGGAQQWAPTPLACKAVSISYKFNGTKIPAGYYIWFTSVFHPNNYVGRIHMLDSRITFAEGNTTYRLRTARSRIGLDSDRHVHLHWYRTLAVHGVWRLGTPENTAGNDFLNAFAWKVPPGGTAGGETVTWSARFYSTTPQNAIQWQWAAAAYSQFDNFPPDYNKLGVKPLDDNHYHPYNSNHAGTPERETQFVTGGAGGGGGSNYTGSLSSTLAVRPCRI